MNYKPLTSLQIKNSKYRYSEKEKVRIARQISLFKSPKRFNTIEVFEDQIFNSANLPAVCIVGERPGKISLNIDEHLAFHGNQSGALMEELVKEIKSCVILTNMVRYRYADSHDILRNDVARMIDTQEDLRSSRDIILRYHKKFRIVLYLLCGVYVSSKFSQYISPYLNKITSHKFSEVIIQHPSYIVRFNQDKNAYAQLIYQYIQNCIL